MKKIFCILFVATVFSGCFDVSIYFIPQKDHSYIVSQRTALSTSFLTMMNSLNDSLNLGEKKPTDTAMIRKMMDSIILSESKKDKGFDKLPGYLSHSVRDSIADSTVFVFIDVHVANADALPPFMKALQEPTKDSSGASTPSELTFDLKVSHLSGTTKFDLTAVRKKKPSADDMNLWDLPDFKGKGMHVGVISANLLPPQAKSPLRSVPGGNEWFIPFETLKDWKDGKTKKAVFVVKD